MKKFFADFKTFISRGNIVDMAVGVIIGSAFSAIVTALTNKIIMPLINLLLSIGGENGLEKAYTFLKKVYDVNGELDLTKSIYVDWGAFITAIINFFIIAFVLFLILKAVMKANSIFKDAVDEVSNKEKKNQRKRARKISKAEKRNYFTVLAEIQAEDKKIADEKAKLAKEEKERKDAEEKLAHPSTEELLLQIRDLLKENAELKQANTEKTKKNAK
ncbi:MAG: large conductance mechanosensitive channel protein MscL [Firmicutes bacterium]|nr:large conductance mechanosensitive channel protein MscL [Bacillota bacterium]